MVNIVVVYHSGYGHTAKQAQAIADGAAGIAGVRAQLVSVEHVEQHWRSLDDADAIIFGSPTYMGSVSAPFKAFMDKPINGSRIDQMINYCESASGFTTHFLAQEDSPHG